MSIEYKGGYLYQLQKDYEHILLQNRWFSGERETEFIWIAGNKLVVKEGYAWDGPSGPTRHTKNFMRGSLVHDALYQLIRMGVLSPDTRVFADQELYHICREDGMWWIRAKMVYYVVRVFGHYAVLKKSENPIVIAP